MKCEKPYRNELKYVIDPPTAEVLKRRLQMCCGHDAHSDSQGFYKVTSLYFDDYQNSALNDNIIGQIHRKKYRIRVYNDQKDFIRLEKKIKHNQWGLKESRVLSPEEYEYAVQGNFEALKAQSNDKLIHSFCQEALTRQLRGRIVVEYDRQAYIYRYGSVRITLDHQIRYRTGSGGLFAQEPVNMPALSENRIVLEVKYSGFLPGHIRKLIQQNTAMQQSVSKYALCRMRSY